MTSPAAAGTSIRVDYPHSKVDRDSDCGELRAFLQQRSRSSSLELPPSLPSPVSMDGRGVVPTLSSGDVETAAQVFRSSVLRLT
jgi:hypothetical protein